MKIGLALGGGGALGAAHLSLLEKMEEEKIEINEICGTSAGSIIGLLYISGGTKNIENFFDAAKNSIFNTKNIVKSPNTTKFYNQLEELLRTYIRKTDFSDLDKKFSAVATNFVSGEMTVLGKGDPVKAVLASSSYPGVFPIQNIAGEKYIDGGVTRNLPIDVLKKRGNDFIVASSLNNKTKFTGKKINRTTVATRAIDILYSEFESFQELGADFVFKPKLSDYKWYRFDKIDNIIKNRRKESDKAIKNLKKEISKKDKIFGII